MYQIITLAKNYLYIAFRTPITVIMAFVMPIIFTAVLGVALGGFDAPTDNRLPILFIDEDGGSLAQQVKAGLESSDIVRLYEDTSDDPLPTNSQTALESIADYQRLLIIPAGFSDTLLRGEPVKVELLVDNPNQQNLTLAEQELTAILNRVSGAINVATMATQQANIIQPFKSSEAEQAYFEQALASAQKELSTPGISVINESATSLEDTTTQTIPSGNNQSSPGNLVMFGLVTLLSASIVLVEERNSGTLRRLVVSPISKSKILTGKSLGPFLLGLAQMAILILVGQFVFNVPWGQSPLALAIMVVSFCLAITGMAIFLATLVKTADQAVGIMIAVSMTMAALGGAWWPIDIVPDFMRTLGHIFPSAWAMDGFQAIILRGADVTQIILPAMILLGYALLFFSLGVWRFKYE